MPAPFNPPRHASACHSDFAAPPERLFEGLRERSEREALALIWDRETAFFERAWLHRLCAQGDANSALSWLCQDEALLDIFGFCPSNAAGRVWDRLARCCGLRSVSGARGRAADERCQALSRQAGPRLLFPPERKERLRLALWTQASEDLGLPRGHGAPHARVLPWPPPAEPMERWLEACRGRADLARPGPALDCSIEAHRLLERFGFGSSPRRAL